MSKLQLAHSQYTSSPSRPKQSTAPSAYSSRMAPSSNTGTYNNPYANGSTKNPSPSKFQSRWSLSSASDDEYGSSGHRRSTSQSTQDKDSLWGLGLPRKSGESSRSKMSKMSKASKMSKVSKAGVGAPYTQSAGMGGTGGTPNTLKGKRSLWSLKSRKSEEGLREGFMRDEMGEIVPVLPPMPDPEAIALVQRQREQQQQAPATPGRGRRVVEGLARRLGLTPKKKKEKE